MTSAVVVLERDVAKLQTDKSNAKWSDVCAPFAKILSVVEGKNDGFAKSVTCTESPRVNIKNYIGKFDWVFLIKSENKKASFEAYYLFNKKIYQEANFSLNTDAPIESYFEISDFRLLLARYLMDALPIGSIVAYDGEKTIEVDSLLAEYPDKAVLYELRYEPIHDLWLPNVLADLEKINHDSRVSQFQLVSGKRRLRKGQVYYFKGKSGRSGQGDEIKDKLTKIKIGSSALEMISAILKESFGSNYMGIRYGHALLASNPVLSKTMEFTVFSEIRSGPLDGLRFRYDNNPSASNINLGKKEYLAWSRTAIGWAFDYEPLSPLSSYISRFDVVPNIRLVDMEASFIFQESYRREPPTFSISANSVLDISLEIGAEYKSDEWRFRVWGDANIPGLQFNNDGQKLTSIKGGFDLYYEVYSLPKGAVVHALGYAAMEQLKLSKSRQAAEKSKSDFDLSEIGYIFPLGGVGVTLSW